MVRRCFDTASELDATRLLTSSVPRRREAWIVDMRFRVSASLAICAVTKAWSALDSLAPGCVDFFLATASRTSSSHFSVA